MAVDVLAVLQRQGAPARAVEAVKTFLAAQARIAGERYAPDRTAEEVAAARVAAVEELRTAEREAALVLDRECDQALAAFDAEREQRAKDRRELSDADA